MILRFLVYSNLFVAICVVLLTWGTGYAINPVFYSSWDATYHLLFVGCSTLLVYNLQRYFGGAFSSDEQDKPFVVENTKIAVLRSSIPTLVVIFCLTKFSLSELFVLAPAGIISLLYVGDLFFNKKNTGLRAVPFLKVFLIAFVWTLVTAIFPIAHKFNFVESKFILIVIERMCFILAITIPFDIRDLAFDEASLQTIPQVFGAKNARKISLAFLLLGAVCTWLLYFIGFYKMPIVLGAIVFYLLTFGLLLGVNKHRSDYYFTFWIEGTMLVWGLVLLVLG